MRSLGRWVAVIAVPVVFAAALQTPAGAARDQRTRTVEERYITPTPGYAALCPLGCVEITPEKGERFVHVEIADASGTATQGYVNQDANEDGHSDIDGEICGRTEAPLKVVPEVPIVVFILAHLEDCPDGFGTTGTVTAIFGNDYKTVARATR